MADQPGAGAVVDHMEGLDDELALSQTPMGRAVMRALTERGHYSETPEDFAWATVDAANVTRFIQERGYTFRNVHDALIDTSLHGEPCACLQGDVEAIGAAL